MADGGLNGYKFVSLSLGVRRLGDITFLNPLMELWAKYHFSIIL